MHQITELPAWERLFKRIVWSQIGDLKGLSILDFGSGEGVTADHYAADNSLTAVEPSDEMLSNAWKDHEYTQIIGDVSSLSVFYDILITQYGKVIAKLTNPFQNRAAIAESLFEILPQTMTLEEARAERLNET